MEKLGPSQELLKGKSEEVEKKAESDARSLLSRHKDLIDPWIAELMIEREVSLAAQEYLKSRAAGLANDGYSKGPGMTLYLSQEGVEKILKIGEEKNFTVEVNQLEGVGPEMYSIEFPKGVFGMPDEGALFTAETTGEERKAEKYFYLPYKSVVRVEGKHGELWQNPKYNWDGSEKV